MAEVKSMEERDWKWLPDVALASTLSYVVNNPQDYVRFSLVCKPWHSVAKDQCRNFTARQVPLVLLPPESLSCGQWSVYSVTHKKFLDFKLKVPHRERYCFRSSYGWLVFAEHGQDDDSLIIKLFNPFTQTKISLPPLNGKLMVCTNKVNLSADPSVQPSDYIVAVGVYSGGQTGLALIRPGRYDEWTYFFGEYREWVRDIAFGMNRKWVYVVGHRGVVVRANVDARAEQATLENVTKIDDFVETTLNKHLFFKKCGLTGIKVFKLQDFSFVEVDDLNGDAVFTGRNSSITLAARDFCSIKPNCVYILDYHIREYNVKDQTMSCFDDLPTRKSQFNRSCYWITPTINL